MIVGLIIGTIVGILIVSIIAMILTESYDPNWGLGGFICLLVLIVSISTGTYIGRYETKYGYLKYIEEYKTLKTTYESAMKSEDLTGLEKVNLINEIADINRELGRNKMHYKKWYYFYLDYKLIESLKEIEVK